MKSEAFYKREVTKFIRKTREAIEWRQADLAEYLGVKRQTVHYWETGKYAPPAWIYLKIMDLMQDVLQRRIESVDKIINNC